MRVLPILFNTDMIRAILDSRKTVTRRLIKADIPHGWEINKDLKGRWRLYEITPRCGIPKEVVFTPPYQSGDILYIRETYRVGAWDVRKQMIAFDYKDGTCGELIYIHDRELFERLVNQSKEDARKAKCEYNGTDFVWKKGESPCRWRPSIHMPKEAARVWLRVTNVRVERLQDMTPDEAMKEGIHICKCPDGYTWKSNTDMHNCYTTSMGAMEALWNSTIKKADLNRYGWNANPGVGVIEFERCEKPEGE